MNIESECDIEAQKETRLIAILKRQTVLMTLVLGLPNPKSVRKAKQLSGAIAAVRQLNPFRSRTLKFIHGQQANDRGLSLGLRKESN